MNKETKILLADDDMGHAGLIKMGFKRSFIENEIIHFKDGQEIMDYLLLNNKTLITDKNSPYVVLLDIRMPKIDGIEVLRRIKNHKKLKKAPVIMVSTDVDPSTIKRCQDLGCHHFFTKPVDYDAFKATISYIAHYVRKLS